MPVRAQKAGAGGDTHREAGGAGRPSLSCQALGRVVSEPWLPTSPRSTPLTPTRSLPATRPLTISPGSPFWPWGKTR